MDIFISHTDTDINMKIDTTKAQYLLSNQVRKQNCAKDYFKTQDLLELKMFKNGQTSENSSKIFLVITVPEMVKKI